MKEDNSARNGAWPMATVLPLPGRAEERSMRSKIIEAASHILYLKAMVTAFGPGDWARPSPLEPVA